MFPALVYILPINNDSMTEEQGLELVQCLKAVARQLGAFVCFGLEMVPSKSSETSAIGPRHATSIHSAREKTHTLICRN